MSLRIVYGNHEGVVSVERWRSVGVASASDRLFKESCLNAPQCTRRGASNNVMCTQ